MASPTVSTKCFDCRAKSSKELEELWPEGEADVCLDKGAEVHYFHETDPSDKHAMELCVTSRTQPPAPAASPESAAGASAAGFPQLRLTHGWLEATLEEPFSLQSFDKKREETWPLVRPSPGLSMVPSCSASSSSRSSKVSKTTAGPYRVEPWRLRRAKGSHKAPRVSLVLIRWAGEHPVGAGCEGDGGWGRFGCPPSDEYMEALVKEGILGHPLLTGENGRRRDFEVFSLLVRSSRDLWSLTSGAPFLSACLRGRRKCSFWMLWPAEWEDIVHADYAGYVERRALFTAMRACEASGLRTGFPHPADLYELITSKTWLASLALHPEALLPAAAMVNKGSVLADAAKAARQALEAIAHGQARSQHGASARRSQDEVEQTGERPPKAARGGNGQRLAKAESKFKGVVKLGWSWEARYIQRYDSEEELAVVMARMLTLPGCTAACCIVQEWVDFDFEMRLYFLPPTAWRHTERLKPTRVEFNAWTGFTSGSDGRPTGFMKFTKADCLGRWQGDAEALKDARRQAVEASQFLIAWLLTLDAQPVPMIRLDFMLRRTAPGKAKVFFGEFCEMGACCLAWEEGPPTIWRAALDSVLA